LKWPSTLQNVLGAHPPVRIVILPIDVSPPKPAGEETKKEDATTAARELLYKDVEKGAQLDLNFILLVLASGAAAALSLTTGLSGVPVGVMVAVALLPPAAVLGILLGNGNPALAMSAGLLLAVNIVCQFGEQDRFLL